MNEDARQEGERRTGISAEPSDDGRRQQGAASASEQPGADELAAPLDDAPPVPRDDPELGVDGVGAGELP